MRTAWTGGDEAMKAIRALGEIAAPMVLTTALQAVGKPIAAEMAAACPKDTGLTAEDFGTKAVEDEHGSVTLFVGAHAGKGGRAFIARFIEFGTAKQPAHPFMRPVYERHRKQLPADIAAALRPAYERVVKRLVRVARKAGR